MWKMWGVGGLCPCASLEGSSTMLGCVQLKNLDGLCQGVGWSKEEVKLN